MHERAVAKVEEQVADALKRGAQLPDRRQAPRGRAAVLRADAADRRARRRADHARGDLRPGRRRHRLRQRGRRWSPAPTTPNTASSPMSSPRTARRQLRLGRALDYGMVAINRVKITGAPIPFGGMKQSGLGREGSRHGIEAFTDLKYRLPRRGLTSNKEKRSCSTSQRTRPPGTATTSSIPRPIWACMRAARRPTRVITGGEGVYITDRNGKTQPRRLRRPLLRQCRLRPPEDRRCDRRAGEEARLLPRLCRPRHRGLDHARQDDHRPRAEGHEPRSISASSGSDANETNIKLIWYYNNVLGRPEKKKIISRWRGYHGSGVMTGSLTGLRAVPQRLRPAARADPAHRGALLFPPRGPLDERGAVLAALRRQARGDDPGRRARTPSPPSSASRSSAPAASCRRPPATGRRSRRC